jgi:hypothetical protein
MFYSVRKFVSCVIVLCKSSRATYIAHETVVGKVCIILIGAIPMCFHLHIQRVISVKTHLILLSLLNVVTFLDS